MRVRLVEVFKGMRFTFLCALLSAVVMGCQQPSLPEPLPEPTPLRYAPPSHEVTNGVCVVFSIVPIPVLVQQLVDAGGTANSNAMIFVFDAVNSDARRQAVTAALLNGAELRGFPR